MDKIIVPTASMVYGLLPMHIKTILINSDGWLVGSAIKSLLDETPVKDFDIIVESCNWHKTIINIRNNPMSINTFGGLKFIIEDTTIDIWPDTLDNFIKKSISLSYAYNINNQLLLKVLPQKTQTP